MLASLEQLEPRHLLLPVSFVSRLITTAQEAFAVQYVQVRVRVRGCGGSETQASTHLPQAIVSYVFVWKSVVAVFWWGGGCALAWIA